MPTVTVDRQDSAGLQLPRQGDAGVSASSSLTLVNGGSSAEISGSASLAERERKEVLSCSYNNL